MSKFIVVFVWRKHLDSSALTRYILEHIQPNPVSADRIWREPEILALKTGARSVAMKLNGAGTAFRLGTAKNLLDALMDVKSSVIPGFTVPYCLLHGTEDAACPISGPEFMWKTAKTPEAEREFHRLEGAYHDLSADPDADKFIKITLDWVEKRLATREQ
jgi:pimeloyl-ACP methyl ester carboxylesterase